MFCLSAPAWAADAARPLVVVLDAGHGGAYPHDGAHGPRGLIEKNVALAVTLKIKELLEQSGTTVVLTRDIDWDLPLARRVQIANDAGADLFVSIHCNSMPKLKDRLTTRGAETYFLSPDPTDREAKALADVENEGAAPVSRALDAVSGILADLALGQAPQNLSWFFLRGVGLNKENWERRHPCRRVDMHPRNSPAGMPALPGFAPGPLLRMPHLTKRGSLPFLASSFRARPGRYPSKPCTSMKRTKAPSS